MTKAGVRFVEPALGCVAKRSPGGGDRQDRVSPNQSPASCCWAAECDRLRDLGAAGAPGGRSVPLLRRTTGIPVVLRRSALEQRTGQGTRGMSKHQEQIIAAAKGKVDEQLLAAAWAKPRGAGTAAAGGGLIASEIGARWAGKQRKGGDAIGIKLGNPGAVAVTATSLVTMEVGVSMGGAIKEVKEVLSTFPLAEIDTIEVKRMGLTGVMEITAGDSSCKLEGKVNDMRELAEVFERAKAAA
jgi:hypothetical protein